MRSTHPRVRGGNARARLGARGSGLLPATLAAIVLLASCRNILGIHSTPRDGAPSDQRGSQVADGTSERQDAGADLLPEDGPSDGDPDEPGQREEAGPAGTGGAGTGGIAGGTGGGGGTGGQGGAGSGGAGATDAAADASPGDGVMSTRDAAADASGDATQTDAGLCAPAWRADDVEARVFDSTATSMTACSLPAAAVPRLAAGLDSAGFRAAQACGACLRVQRAGVAGGATVVVQVVERSSVAGVILSRAAMDQIAPGTNLVRVSWQLVPCDTGNQPLRYVIKDGSNPGYVGVQIRNARYPVTRVVAVVGARSVELALQPYNYWESTAAGAGPLTLRITDVNGQLVEDSGIAIVPSAETQGASQFPICQ